MALLTDHKTSLVNSCFSTWPYNIFHTNFSSRVLKRQNVFNNYLSASRSFCCLCSCCSIFFVYISSTIDSAEKPWRIHTVSQLCCTKDHSTSRQRTWNTVAHEDRMFVQSAKLQFDTNSDASYGVFPLLLHNPWKQYKSMRISVSIVYGQWMYGLLPSPHSVAINLIGNDVIRISRDIYNLMGSLAISPTSQISELKLIRSRVRADRKSPQS